MILVEDLGVEQQEFSVLLSVRLIQLHHLLLTLGGEPLYLLTFQGLSAQLRLNV